MNVVKRGKNVVWAKICSRMSLFVSVLSICTVLLLTGCDQTPLPPDTRFAENYLREQTYDHCKRYRKMYQIYSTGESDRYVFFSPAEEVNYKGWEIKNAGENVELNCLFRRYDTVGQVYHEMVSHEFSPMTKTTSDKHPYTMTLKIEFTCMDKIYHDDLEYNAGMIWIYNKDKYADLNKMDLQNMFATMWKPTMDLPLLVWRMKKDTGSGKKMIREIPLRYDAEDTVWQWQDINGKWRNGFASETKLDEFETLAGADTVCENLQTLLPETAAVKNTILSMEYASYLCSNEDKELLKRYLQNEFLFFCPGKKEPVWLEKHQYNASRKLVTVYNQITIEHKKYTVWQALQTLNQHHHAIPLVQDLIWQHVDKELDKNLKMICNTDFIEKDQKKVYLKKFLKRLDECANLESNPRFLGVKKQCLNSLDKIDQDTEE